MEFHIGINDNYESNLFLRALWSNFRQHYGKFGWEFMPHKIGKENRISFGFSNIGEVGIYYKKKGCIDRLYFDTSEDSATVEGIIVKSLDQYKKPNQKTLKSSVNGLHEGACFLGANFRIHPAGEKKTNIYVTVHGFDDNDIQVEHSKKLRELLSFLAVETNLPFWGEMNLFEDLVVDQTEEHFNSDLEWIDGLNLNDEGSFIVSKNGKDFIDFILDNHEKKENYRNFIKACELFNRGRIFDAKTNDLHLSDPVEIASINSEISSILYISAIECLARINKEKEKACDACGQKIYSIAKGVNDLIEKHGGVAVKEYIKNFYRKRSKFLHEGSLFSDYSYGGSSIPLLDPQSSSGCHYQTSYPNINLREFTSFTIRQILRKENIK